jgi:hypothetical protein
VPAGRGLSGSAGHGRTKVEYVSDGDGKLLRPDCPMKPRGYAVLPVSAMYSARRAFSWAAVRVVSAEGMEANVKRSAGKDAVVRFQLEKEGERGGES